MTRTRKLYAAGAIGIIATALGVLWLSNRALAVDVTLSQSLAASTEPWKGLYYEEAAKCTQCHALPTPATRGSTDLVVLSEWSIWKVQDKHAQAFAVLKGERGKRIAALLKKDVLSAETGCLGCHAMSTLPGKGMSTIDPEDGVSCGGCHGPSGGKNSADKDGWFSPHQKKEWRDLSGEKKHAQGLRNLRDPIIRAELCASCHIGNAEEGKVVSHAMMAAGHPPLPPIEIATFSRNEPQHWRNAPDVPYIKQGDADVKKRFGVKDPAFQQTEFALIGNIVAFRESLRLAATRTNFGGDAKVLFPEMAITSEGSNTPESRWPEIAMAHSDCFACHHDLRYPGFRQQRGFSYAPPGLKLDERVIPGRPMLRFWPLGGLTAGTEIATTNKIEGLKPALIDLTKATNLRPFGSPEALGKSARAGITWCDALLKELSTTEINRDKAFAIARSLAATYGKDAKMVADYDTARQVSSLLQIVCNDLKVSGDPLKKLTDELNLEPYSLNRGKRSEVMMEVIRDVLKQPAGEAKFDNGAKSFLDFAVDLRDQAKVDSMLGNDFLGQLFLKLGNKEFTAGLVKENIASRLQKLSDEEQRKALTALANYNHKQFKERLEEIAKLLPDK